MRSFRIWLAKLIVGNDAVVLRSDLVMPDEPTTWFGASNGDGVEVWPVLKNFTAVNLPPVKGSQTNAQD